MTRLLLLLPAFVALAACERNVAPSRTPPPQHVEGSDGAPVLPAAEAVTRAAVSRADPETLTGADIAKVLTRGPGCRFAYSRNSSPIVVLRAAEGPQPGAGVMKLHGALVQLRPGSDASFNTLKAGARLTAEGLDITIAPLGDAAADQPVRKAELKFRLKQGLEVGYRGFYACDGPEGTAAAS